MRRLAVALAVMGSAWACTGASSPAAPTLSSDFSLTLSSSVPYVYLGMTQQVVAAASDGRSLTGGVWGSDTPAVATVDTTGLVSGVGAGQSNIYLISGGHQGTKLLRGMPRVAGTFQGNYTVSSCTQDGQFGESDPCSKFPVGASAPYTFIFSQTGEGVTGNFSLGIVNFGDFGSIITVPGAFTFGGRAALQSDPINILATWSLSQTIANTLGGTVNAVFSTPALSGSATLVGFISTVTKISSVDAMVRSVAPRTLDGALRDLLNR